MVRLPTKVMWLDFPQKVNLGLVLFSRSEIFVVRRSNADLVRCDRSLFNIVKNVYQVRLV
jgi:hypothetical protein